MPRCTSCAILAPHDLTSGRGNGGNYAAGVPFTFLGHTDVKELALYLQDSITLKNWSFNLGVRGDFYNGLGRDRQAEPRAGTISGAPLTADQEFQAGLFCGSQRPTPTTLIGTSFPGSPALACPESQFGSTLLKVPAPFKENDDHNPQRVASRSVFDVSVGHDNLFKGDKYKVSLQLTAINVTNKYRLYNFLSTFSGTHYLTPRTLTAQIGFHF